MLEKHYRRLLPATAPRSGQQYACEVDPEKCSGGKADQKNRLDKETFLQCSTRHEAGQWQESFAAAG